MIVALLDPVTGIKPEVIAGIVNASGEFIGDLMGASDPSATADLLESTQGRNFVRDLVNLLATGDNYTKLQPLLNALASDEAMAASRAMNHAMLSHPRKNELLNYLATQMNKPGNSNALKWVTMHTVMPEDVDMGPIWMDKNMYGTFLEAVVEPYPL